MKTKLENELAEANSKIQHLLDHCKDGECSVCAEIICKHHEPLHFHHDGCPSCESNPTADQIGKAWLEDSSIERWFPITAEELKKHRARFKWLHDCSTGQTDPEGYEWGIYRVKWESGKAVSVLQTNSDLSDLDKEMSREISQTCRHSYREDSTVCEICGS